MPFPTDEELKRVRKLLKNVEGTTIIGKNGTKVDRFKYEICQKFLAFYEDNNMSQKELAILLSLDEAHVSKLVRCKIEIFTIDRLLKLLEIIEPDYKIKLAN